MIRIFLAVIFTLSTVTCGINLSGGALFLVGLFMSGFGLGSLILFTATFGGKK